MVPLYGPEKPSFIFYYCLIEVEGIGQTELELWYLVNIEILNNSRKLRLAVQCSILCIYVILHTVLAELSFVNTELCNTIAQTGQAGMICKPSLPLCSSFMLYDSPRLEFYVPKFEVEMTY